jgi:hypothetical protein
VSFVLKSCVEEEGFPEIEYVEGCCFMLSCRDRFSSPIRMATFLDSFVTPFSNIVTPEHHAFTICK